MLAGLLICAGAGAGLGLAGCRRRGARAWVVHVTMAAAMLAMLAPSLDPFGVSGPLVWAGALACLAIWAACAAVPFAREVEVPSGHRPDRVRELLDLWVMAFLLLLMPGMHGLPAADAPGTWTHPGGNGPAGGHHAGTLGSVLGTPPSEHLMTGAVAHDVRAAVLLLVVVWLVALAWLQVRAPRGGRRSDVAGAGSLLSALAMAGMALA